MGPVTEDVTDKHDQNFPIEEKAVTTGAPLAQVGVPPASCPFPRDSGSGLWEGGLGMWIFTVLWGNLTTREMV